jgi:hypothetical protein
MFVDWELGCADKARAEASFDNSLNVLVLFVVSQAFADCRANS